MSSAGLSGAYWLAYVSHQAGGVAKRRSAARLVNFPRRRIARLSFLLLRGTFRPLTAVSPELSARWAEFLFRTPPRYRQTEKERAFLARGHRSRVPFGRGSLAVWSWGKEGPAVLLVHGWAGHAGRLTAFVPRLVEAGFRAIAFDAPGHGLSSGWQSSLPEFAASIRAVSRETGPVVALIAHSFGAAAATLAMAEGLAVERALFLAPATDPDQYSGRFTNMLRISQPVRESMKRRLERRYGVRWSSFSLVERAAVMRVPLLVFHDRGDSKIPFRLGAAIARAWPGAELIATDRLGHHKILRDATLISRAVSFLSCARPIPLIEAESAERPAPPLAAPMTSPPSGTMPLLADRHILEGRGPGSPATL